MAEAQTTAKTVVRLPFAGAKRNRVPATVTALDVDGDLLRVAIGTRRGDQVEFSNVSVAPLGLPADAERDDPEVVGAAVRRSLDELKLKPGTVVFGVPRGKAIVRMVSLPEVEDSRELASMVQLQVGRDLPYRKEDAVIDFEVRQPRAVETPAPAAGAPDDKAGTPPAQVEALVAIVQTGVVSFYQKLCEAAGLKLAALTFLPYANVRCLQACGLTAETQEIVALVSLRADEVTVDVIDRGTLLFSRDATIVDEHAEPADSATEGAAEPQAPTAETAAPPPVSLVERITIEVVRSFHAFGGMAAGARVSRFVVAGGTGQEGEVADALGRRFNLPVTLLDPNAAGKVNSSDTSAVSGAVSGMGVVIAATDPDGLPFNFLAPKRPAAPRDMRRIGLLAAAAVILLLAFGVFGVRTHLIGKRVRVQQAIQAEINALQKNQALFRRTRSQAAVIQDWQKDERNWLEHYAYLTAVLPGSEEIYITSFTIGAQGSIRLAVQARNGEVLARLDKQLRDAGYEVKPQAITPGTDRFGYDFKSSVELIVPAKMKLDLSKIKPPPQRPADDNSLNLGAKGPGAKNQSPSITVYGGGK